MLSSLVLRSRGQLLAVFASFAFVFSSSIGMAGSPPTPGSAFERIVEAIGKIKREYVDPVDDAKLVAGCREGISAQVSERSDSRQSTRAESLVPKAALDEVTDAVATIKQQYPELGEDNKLVDACLRGMLAGLDRRSAYLDEEDFRDLQVGSGPSAGIGIEIGIEGNRPKIVSPIDGGPGYRAGLKGGDIIIRIDHASTEGRTLRDIVKRLRGTAGSTVALTIERAGTREPTEFVLKGEVIRIRSVRWKSVAPGLAYIRISQFQQFTAENLARAIEDSYRENQGNLQGLILDLRNNPGGLLNACVAVSAAFLPQGSLVVYTAGRTEDSKMRLHVSPENYLRRNQQDYIRKLPLEVKTVPMVVLVNGASAAGSEIVAAALQDHKRAKILGARTFGQGLIHTIFPLARTTAIKLVTAKFFRPSGAAIAEIGVMPDVVIKEGEGSAPAFGSADDLQLHEAVRILVGNSVNVAPLSAGMRPDRAVQSRLIRAAVTGDTAGVRAALAQGADVNEPTQAAPPIFPTGPTALEFAAINGHTETVKLLLESGADMKRFGGGALFAAASGGHFNTVRLLVERGAGINDQIPPVGLTALHAAARTGHPDIVEFLVANGADVQLRAKTGETPLVVAEKNRRHRVVEILRNAGAKE